MKEFEAMEKNGKAIQKKAKQKKVDDVLRKSLRNKRDYEEMKKKNVTEQKNYATIPKEYETMRKIDEAIQKLSKKSFEVFEEAMKKNYETVKKKRHETKMLKIKKIIYHVGEAGTLVSKCSL